MYIYIKAFHLIIDFAWIAALLIYPRYKIHQLASSPGQEMFETMKSASQKLRKIILTPSLMLVWLSGLFLLYLNPDLLSQGWMHVKLTILFILSALHGYLVGVGRKIDGGARVNTTQLKILNETPFVLMSVVVLLAVSKAF